MCACVCVYYGCVTCVRDVRVRLQIVNQIATQHKDEHTTDAWVEFQEDKIYMIQGPPGTGKTHCIGVRTALSATHMCTLTCKLQAAAGPAAGPSKNEHSL